MPDHQPRPSSRAATQVISRSLATDIGVMLIGAAVTALAAQVTIPWQPVPVTLQTLAVMLCGLSLGARRGALSQLAYLTAGAAGAPVFAGWAGGAQHVFGPTGGYLAGFVAMAGILGWLAERGWNQRFLSCAGALAIGIVVQLGLGTAWLACYLGWKTAWFAGCWPFLPIEAAKATAVLAAFGVWSRTRVACSVWRSSPEGAAHYSEGRKPWSSG